MNPAQGPPVATYQTRVSGYVGLDRGAGDAALAAYAELYGQVQRKLFAEVAAGRSAAPLKSDYMREHGISARLFNAVRVSLEGKVSAVRAAQRLRVNGLERRIAQAERQVAEAEEQGRWQQVHQKRRRLANLKSRLAGLEGDIAAGRVRLCFGSKRLWRKQHHLEANGYGSHEEWLQDWRDARSNEFFVLGSRDETSGCQLCVASIGDDGTLTLRLRLPDCLAEQHGKYLVIAGVRFAYGHEQVLAGLGSNAEYAAYRREHGEKAARATSLGTVAALTKSTPAISRSRSPSSALSNASARLTVRTDGLPRWETSLRRERSDSVSLTLYLLTLYLMAVLSGYSPTEKSYPSMTAFSYAGETAPYEGRTKPMTTAQRQLQMAL